MTETGEFPEIPPPPPESAPEISDGFNEAAEPPPEAVEAPAEPVETSAESYVETEADVNADTGTEALFDEALEAPDDYWAGGETTEAFNAAAAPPEAPAETATSDGGEASLTESFNEAAQPATEEQAEEEKEGDPLDLQNERADWNPPPHLRGPSP